MRTYDISVVEAALEQVKDDLKGLPISDWLENPENIAMVNDRGDVGLLECRGGGVYCPHMFFFSRGKDAVKAGAEFLTEAFELGAKVLVGMTPLDKKGAVWLVKHLGLTIVGNQDIDGRPHMISTLIKKDWDVQSSRR